MKKSIALATLLIVLIGGIVFQYYITGLPELERPITLEEARFTTEQGSVSATFVDSEGAAFSFGIRASDKVESSEFPAFYIRNPELVPYMYWPGINGPDERKLLQLVDGWLQRNAPPELMRRLEQGKTEDLSPSEQEVAAVYAVYELLRERHQG